MPPERQPTQKRRHLPFKPPSRASGSPATTAGPSTSKPATKTKKTPTQTTAASSSKPKGFTKSTSKPKPAKASSSRQKPSPSTSATNTDSNSDAESDGNSDTNATTRSPTSGPASDDEDANDANYILAEITHGEPDTEDVLSSDPLIPPKLLTKLVHHHFRNPKTKIAKDANEVVAKYIDVFVREAVARAAFERAEEGNAAGGAGRSVADGFLEVEDLEKMGPQLAMDF